MKAEDPTPGPGGAHVERRALDVAAMPRDGMWRTIELVDKTGSTNADLLARGRQGAAEGLVLVAEQQTAGRGRLGRQWVSPPRAALTFSMLLRPAAVPVPKRGWLPLLAGVAVAAAVRGATGVDATLKWPNDVLVGASPAHSQGGKLAGILAEATGDAVVVGIGLNVSTEPDELPPPGPGALPATSLRALGSKLLDREPLLTGILLAFERRYQAWRQARGNPSALRAEYLRYCETLGRQVRVERPGGQVLSGEAVDVDSDGRLVVLVSSERAVRAGRAVIPVAAGDVVHVRLAGWITNSPGHCALGLVGVHTGRVPARPLRAKTRPYCLSGNGVHIWLTPVTLLSASSRSPGRQRRCCRRCNASRTGRPAATVPGRGC